MVRQNSQTQAHANSENQRSSETQNIENDKKDGKSDSEYSVVCSERIMLLKQQKRSSENQIPFSDDLVGLVTAIWLFG